MIFGTWRTYKLHKATNEMVLTL